MLKRTLQDGDFVLALWEHHWGHKIKPGRGLGGQFHTCHTSNHCILRPKVLNFWLIFYHKILSSSKEMQIGDQKEYSQLQWWYHSSSICKFITKKFLYNSFYVALFWNLWVWHRNAKGPFALFSVSSISFGAVLNDTHLRMCSFEMIWIRISDSSDLGSWYIKWIGESILDKDSSVQLRSTIIWVILDH